MDKKSKYRNTSTRHLLKKLKEYAVVENMFCDMDYSKEIKEVEYEILLRTEKVVNE